ncbi:MAG: DOMON domain-containing protein, partial [Rectinema sp.]
TVLVASSAFAVDVDGVIAKDEYSGETTMIDNSFRFLWKVEGDRIFFAIDAVSPGWVAVGFDPGTIMSKADMVFGIVSANGDVKAVDAWSAGMFGPPRPDVDLGGKANVLTYAGKRNGDKVVFEFSRLLAAGDKFDKTLPATGKVKLICAIGPNLDSTVKHRKTGKGTMDLGGAK